jgi:citrate synthase
LPNETELTKWVADITQHTMLHETTKKFMEGFRYNAHPMAMLISTVAALSTVYPEAREIHDPKNRLHQIVRLIAKIPSIAAMAYRHSLGFPYVYPDSVGPFLISRDLSSSPSGPVRLCGRWLFAALG